MNYYEKTLEQKTFFSGIILNLRVDKVLLPDGSTSTREIVEHNGGVAVVAIRNGKLLLVKQFRKPLEKEIIEIPAGKLNKNEDPFKCALREMEEETGLIPVNLQFLTSIYTAPGFCSEKLFIYLAEEFMEGTINRDEDEFMDVIEVEIPEVISMIKNGDICDAKTICGVLMYLQFNK
jgi:ADP-ribose pyrophosphatase